MRYHLALEAAWDAGGGLACLAAAAVLALGANLQSVVLLALPLVALQAVGLSASYASRGGPAARAGTVPASAPVSALTRNAAKSTTAARRRTESGPPASVAAPRPPRG